jgi:type II secretory pathway pseudopilin PulG
LGFGVSIVVVIIIIVTVLVVILLSRHRTAKKQAYTRVSTRLLFQALEQAKKDAREAPYREGLKRPEDGELFMVFFSLFFLYLLFFSLGARTREKDCHKEVTPLSFCGFLSLILSLSLSLSPLPPLSPLCTANAAI